MRAQTGDFAILRFAGGLLNANACRSAGSFTQLSDNLYARNFEVSGATRLKAYLIQFSFTFLYTFILLNCILSILINAYIRLRSTFKEFARVQQHEMQHLTVCPPLLSPPPPPRPHSFDGKLQWETWSPVSVINILNSSFHDFRCMGSKLLTCSYHFSPVTLACDQLTLRK